MSDRIKKLNIINWVVISLIVALGCTLIALIPRMYKPGDTELTSTSDEFLDYEPVPGTDLKFPPKVVQDMIDNPPASLSAGLREVEKYQLDDLESLVKWRAQVGEIKGQALAPDGGIYLRTEASMLFAIGPDGAVRWSKSVKDSSPYGPVVDADGNVFVAERQKIHSFTADGELRFEHDTPRYAILSIALDSKGNLIFKQYSGNREEQSIIALDKDGTEKWTYHAPPEFELTNQPVRAGTKGRVYDMGKGGVFQSLTHVGSRGWGLGMNENARGPAVDSRGLIYLAATPDPQKPWEWLLMCLEPGMGKEVWHVELPNYVKHGPWVTPDGRVYVLCSPPKSNYMHPLPVLVYGEKGELVWEAGVLNAQTLVVPPDATGPLGILTSDGAILLDSNGEMLFSLNEYAGQPMPLLISPEGIVYCHGNGALVALDLNAYSP